MFCAQDLIRLYQSIWLNLNLVPTYAFTPSGTSCQPLSGFVYGSCISFCRDDLDYLSLCRESDCVSLNWALWSHFSSDWFVRFIQARCWTLIPTFLSALYGQNTGQETGWSFTLSLPGLSLIHYYMILYYTVYACIKGRCVVWNFRNKIHIHQVSNSQLPTM